MDLFVIRILLNTLIILFSAHYINGIVVMNDLDTLIFGVVLGLINATIRPILILLTIPITIITLGLFILLINSFTFWLAGILSYGVYISSVSGAFFGGVLITFTGIITNYFFSKKFE